MSSTHSNNDIEDTKVIHTGQLLDDSYEIIKNMDIQSKDLNSKSNKKIIAGEGNMESIYATEPALSNRLK